MKHHLFLLSLRIFIALTIFMALPTAALAGDWQAYNFTDQYRNVCTLGNKLYILKSNSLVRADINTWHIEGELTREDGLSTHDIVDICGTDDQQRLAIVHSNGYIDVMRSDGSIWTISDLYNDPMPGIDKSIQSARVQGDLLFLLTAYGFAVVDLSNEVFLQNFNLGFPVTCAWLYSGDWYFSCKSQLGKYYGTYYCPRQGSNPYVMSSWKRSCATIVNSAIILHNGTVEECWLWANDKTLQRQSPGHRGTTRCSEVNAITSIHRAGPYVVTMGNDGMTFYDTRLGHAPAYDESVQPGQRQTFSSASHAKAIKLSVLSAASADGSDSLSLAFLYPGNGIMADDFQLTSNAISSSSLFDNVALSVKNNQQSASINRIVNDGHGKLAFTIIPNVITTNYATIVKTMGIMTTYDQNTGKWENQTDAMVVPYLTQGNKRFTGVIGLAADPHHPERFLFSTMEDGIVIVDHDTLLVRYNNVTTNNGLTNYASGCTRIGGVVIDEDENLWCFDEGHNDIIRLLRHADGKWYKFKIPGLEKSFGFQHLLFSRYGGHYRLWGYQEFSYMKTYLFCYDFGTDLTDTKDDRYSFFNELTPDNPADGASFVPYYGRNLYETANGAIWICNTSGLYVIDNPDDVFDHPGQVRKVMGDHIPTSLSADSRQNLWMTTEDSGLYLLSPDGRKVLAHFTTDNSLLASNELTWVNCDTTYNCVWITSNSQILSYTYDPDDYSTDQVVHQHSQAHCYPSTVPVGSLSMVNVFGLQAESQVTLTNSKGRVLKQDTALGNILSFDVSQLPIGIYDIFGIDEKGYRGLLTSFEVTHQ